MSRRDSDVPSVSEDLVDYMALRHGEPGDPVFGLHYDKGGML